jgi:medium-chain acyl-[acyl-carrier-protein] hydrolase
VTRNPFVVPPRRPAPRASLRLFCFPGAGGGASIFRAWSEGFPPEIEVYAVQLPGREGRWMEPPFTRVQPLVESLAQALSRWVDKPFAFFGHSMGALISFELARYLRRTKDLGPIHLLASAYPAPHRPDRFPQLHHLPEPELLEELRRLNGTPEEILQNRELMALLLPTIRADCALCETYVHAIEPPLDCAISAYIGEHDPRVRYEDAAAWCYHTRQPFTLRVFPGHHFFLHTASAALRRAIAQELLRSLTRFGVSGRDPPSRIWR